MTLLPILQISIGSTTYTYTHKNYASNHMAGLSLYTCCYVESLKRR
uniref:Uncharacterized protein n=1 Tax=Rhizophora mucronata TaxID=61149 RepID=A0A2P2PU72_RHIMU